MLKRFLDGLIFGVGFLFITVAQASPRGGGPESLSFWKNQAEFFRGLGYPEEDLFKQDLKKYYKSVYSGRLLQRFSDWIDDGYLDSEYYSSFYSNLEDTEYGDFEMLSEGAYKVKSIQESCYDLNYNAPVMETIVSDYKVTNYTQKEVNAWLWEPDPLMSSSACLKIDAVIEFKLDESGLIYEENKSIVSSVLTLKP